MFITIQQVKAARALLDWTQEDLANRANIDVNRIRGFESGRSRPLEVVEAIQDTFTREGIVFTPQSVQLNPTAVITVEGEGWFLRVLDDVYQTLIDQPHAEYLCFCTDDQASPPDVNDRLRKLRRAGIRVRQLVQEGNTYLMGPLPEYRYIPKDRFKNDVAIVYGSKVAICLQAGTKAMIFKDADLAVTWRNIFNVLWDQLKQPERSDAPERF